jgi:hypothetical protein
MSNEYIRTLPDENRIGCRIEIQENINLTCSRLRNQAQKREIEMRAVTNNFGRQKKTDDDAAI